MSVRKKYAVFFYTWFSALLDCFIKMPITCMLLVVIKGVTWKRHNLIINKKQQTLAAMKATD